jgi:hypothetical protein
VRTKNHSTKSRPRRLVLRRPPTVLSQPKRPLALLSLDHIDAIARAACGPHINCRSAIGVVLGHMQRCDIRRQSPRYHNSCRRRQCFPARHRHRSCEGSSAFSCTIGFSEPGIDDESVASLCHQMIHVTELCLFAGPFGSRPCACSDLRRRRPTRPTAVRRGIRIPCREMRVIRAFQPFGTGSAIASFGRCLGTHWGKSKKTVQFKCRTSSQTGT